LACIRVLWENSAFLSRRTCFLRRSYLCRKLKKGKTQSSRRAFSIFNTQRGRYLLWGNTLVGAIAYSLRGIARGRKNEERDKREESPSLSLSLSERLSLKPAEQRWGQPKGKINQDWIEWCGKGALKRRIGANMPQLYGISVLFHAPLCAENYSGTRNIPFENAF